MVYVRVWDVAMDGIDHVVCGLWGCVGEGLRLHVRSFCLVGLGMGSIGGSVIYGAGSGA